MDMLVRKVARAKWERKSYLEGPDVPADVVNCLRPSENALSFWLCTNEATSIDEVTLALTTGLERIDRVHVVLFPRSEVEGLGIQLQSSAGRTPVGSLRNRHVDAVRLNIGNLAAIAHLMLDRVRSNDSCHLYTKRQVIQLVRQAVENRLVQIDELAPGIQSGIRGEPGIP